MSSYTVLMQQQESYEFKKKDDIEVIQMGMI